MDPLRPTIFHEDWWLEIACNGRYDVAEVKEDGRVIGRWPYRQYSRFGMTTVNMPPLTHFLGPGIDAGVGSESTRYLKSIEIAVQLSRLLPKVHSFKQKMHGGLRDAAAFQMASFETGVQFTYELQPEDEARLWRGMKDKTRNVIRKSLRSENETFVQDADEFVDFYFSSTAAMGRTVDIDPSICLSLVRESIWRQRGQIYAVRNAQGRLNAALFCVWDQRATYYLMSARDPHSGNGSVSRLLWSAIRDSSRRGLVFDFDGVAYRGSVQFYAGFGAVSSPRYIVSSSSLRFRLLREARRLIKSQDNPFT